MAPKSKAKARSRSTSAAPKAKGKARAKGAATPPPGAATAGAAEAQAQALSPEARAAVRLQAAARRWLARRAAATLREERRRHEEEVAQAVREAELAALRSERRRQEAEQKKADEKKRKAKQLVEDTKKLLEAAYEGDVEGVRRLLGAGELRVDACDANGLTALSEAASGGRGDVAGLLLERKADPNSRGEFQRTPLWRAAYAGHGDVAMQLLEAGGDPRLFDEQGCMPADVAQDSGVATALRGWDIARTEQLLEEYEGWAEDIRLEREFRIKQAMRDVEGEYEAARAVHEAAQHALARAKAEFRRRQKEHGLGLAAGDQVARDACASADAQVERCGREAAEAQRRFDQANLKRLEQAESCGMEMEKRPGREVCIPDLNNVLMRDIGDRIAKATQWPLVIDPSDCAKKMIAYAGCSVLSFWRSEEVEPERLRVALLSMIRVGGILALDLVCFGAGVDRQLLAEPFEQVRAGLFADLLSRKLFETPSGSYWPKFTELARKDEKGRFSVEQFDPKRTAKFKFMVVTDSDMPHRDLLELFDPLRICPARA